MFVYGSPRPEFIALATWLVFGRLYAYLEMHDTEV